jgi:hypothetical protein
MRELTNVELPVRVLHADPIDTQTFQVRTETLLPEWRQSESGEWVREEDDTDSWPLALGLIVAAVLAIAAIVIPLVLVIRAGRGSM